MNKVDTLVKEEFAAIVSGWTLISGYNAITDRLEELGKWVEKNKPLTENEQKTVDLMIQCQIARGFEEEII